MTPERDPEFKDTDFSHPYRAPQPAPDGRGDGYDPDGGAVAAEFRAAFRLKDRPVEYAGPDDDDDDPDGDDDFDDDDEDEDSDTDSDIDDDDDDDDEK